MLKRAFSSAVADFVQISSKRKLPALFKDDTDRDIRDIKGFFEYIMDMAQPHPKLPDRLLLGQANLRKLAIL